MLRLFPLFLFILHTIEIPAGNARQTAMGNIGTNSMGSGANYSNPAGLVWNIHHDISTTYASHHLISALDRPFLTYSKSKNDKAYALFYTQTGDKRLQHNSLSLSYAQLFSDKFSLALRLGLSHLEFSDNYGSKTLLHADMGMIIKLNEKLNFGFYILNLGRSKLINKYNERSENAVMTGISYKSSELFTLELEMEKYALRPLNVKLGMEYQVLHSFFLRGGFQSSYRRFSAGFGYSVKRLVFDSTIYYTHPIGYSLVFSLSINLEKLS